MGFKTNFNVGDIIKRTWHTKEGKLYGHTVFLFLEKIPNSFETLGYIEHANRNDLLYNEANLFRIITCAGISLSAGAYTDIIFEDKLLIPGWESILDHLKIKLKEYEMENR